MFLHVQSYVAVFGVISAFLSPIVAASKLVVQVQYQHPIQSTAHSAACTFSNYVSLGDSYSAGIRAIKGGQLPICTSGSNDFDSVTNCTTATCALNKGSYAYQYFDQQQPTDFRFLACSGANSDGCQSKQVPLAGGADLVTITIGGNNGNAFATIVLKCVYAFFWYKGKGCDSAIANANQALLQAPAKLSALFKAIKAKESPSTQVAVLSYVQFWPQSCVSSSDEASVGDSCACQSKALGAASPAQRGKINALVQGVNKALQTAANNAGFVYVDVDSAFEGHRMCDSGTPYLMWNPCLFGICDPDRDRKGRGPKDGFGDPKIDWFNVGVFHPTQQGHAVYLKQLDAKLGCA